MKRLFLFIAVIMLLVFIISSCSTSESKDNSDNSLPSEATNSDASNDTDSTDSVYDISDSSNISNETSDTTSTPDETSDTTSEQTSVDSQTFTFNVKEDMPEYECVTKVHSEKGYITEIIITEKDSGKAVQTIYPQDFWLENTNFTKQSLYFMDVTFDGSVDILMPLYATRRLSIAAFVWDENDMQFKYQPDFQELGYLTIDSENERILTHNFILLDSVRNSEFYTVWQYDGEKYIVDKQFTITPSEDLTKAVFKETSGKIGSEVVTAEFELSLDENGEYDKTDEKIKPYYEAGSYWDLDNDRWDSQFRAEFK